MQTQTAHSEVSRHKCLIYDGHPSEQLPVVIPLLTDGLQNNWRCLYLGSPEMVQMVDIALVATGVDTSRECERGALVFSSDRSHLAEGKFQPKKMIDELSSMIDGALKDGFEGLCATGDMRWELGPDKNFEMLLDYEARLEQIFRTKPLRGICQYHRDVIPAQAVRDALVAHKSAYIGSVLNHDNLFYIPPELLLEKGGTASSKQGEWMCQQIIRVLNAEEKRDRALGALRESEAHQRQLAEQLAELNRDLERRVTERTAELQVANKHLESFSYSVSHDLRAPLRSIVGFSDILAQDFAEVLGEEGRHHLQRVSANAQHMGELIEGMLTLSRVVRADVHRASVDLTALAEDVRREICESAPNRAVEFVIQKELRVTGDRALLRSVLTNLLGNAWKFTSKCASARIEVGKTGPEGDLTTFHVRDNGAGFEMKRAERLFGTFQRLHSQEEFPGTGIGLATVQRIVSKHGGRIWAESAPNHGATFFFTLPADHSEA
jgi:signal transduction histidine kinase